MGFSDNIYLAADYHARGVASADLAPQGGGGGGAKNINKLKSYKFSHRVCL